MQGSRMAVVDTSGTRQSRTAWFFFLPQEGLPRLGYNMCTVAAPAQRGNEHFTSSCPRGYMLMAPSPAPEAKGQLLWAEQGCATQTKNMSREGSLSKPQKPTESPENTSQLISNPHTHSKNRGHTCGKRVTYKSR